MPPDINEVSQLTELKLNNNKLKEVMEKWKIVSRFNSSPANYNETCETRVSTINTRHNRH